MCRFSTSLSILDLLTFINFIAKPKHSKEYLRLILESNIEDAETEVALNLICVDETTRQTIDIPIRPRSVRDIKSEVHRKHNRLDGEGIKIGSETKNKSRHDRSDIHVKTGKIHLLFNKSKI